jgi:hypothetical protein
VRGDRTAQRRAGIDLIIAGIALVDPAAQRGRIVRAAQFLRTRCSRRRAQRDAERSKSAQDRGTARQEPISALPGRETDSTVRFYG